MFKTPSYVDRAIQQPVTVKMKLVRKNNNDDFSEPIDFMYKPEEFGELVLLGAILSTKANQISGSLHFNSEYSLLYFHIARLY